MERRLNLEDATQKMQPMRKALALYRSADIYPPPLLDRFRANSNKQANLWKIV